MKFLQSNHKINTMFGEIIFTLIDKTTFLRITVDQISSFHSHLEYLIYKLSVSLFVMGRLSESYN